MALFFDTEAEKIHAKLHLHHDRKWGYVVYRTAYDDDAQWATSMQRRTAYVQARMDKKEKIDLIKDSFALDVRDDKSKLQGATRSQVRELFVQWRESVGGRRSLTKYTNCIYVDQEVIDAVIGGGDPYSNDPKINLNPSAFVKILDDQFTDIPDQLESDDESDDELRKKLNSGDEGHESIEGCRRYNVGWMKAAAAKLAPRMYTSLMNGGWTSAYGRPPAMMSR